MMLIQLALIALWVWTWDRSMFSVRWLHIRTLAVLGYAWLACEVAQPQTFLSLLCDWLVWIDIASIVLAIWNRDCRYFPHQPGAT